MLIRRLGKMPMELVRGMRAIGSSRNNKGRASLAPPPRIMTNWVNGFTICLWVIPLLIENHYALFNVKLNQLCLQSNLSNAEYIQLRKLYKIYNGKDNKWKVWSTMGMVQCLCMGNRLGLMLANHW